MPPGLSLRVSHRGWLVVLGAFLIQVVGFGAIYSSAAFSAEIAASIGMNRADADLVMGLSLGLSFLVSAISGALADRFGPRLLAAVQCWFPAKRGLAADLAGTANLVPCAWPRYGEEAMARLAPPIMALSYTTRLARRDARAVRPRRASVGWLAASNGGPATTRGECRQGESR
jgi:hypothetical protein